MIKSVFSSFCYDCFTNNRPFVQQNCVAHLFLRGLQNKRALAHLPNVLFLTVLRRENFFVFFFALFSLYAHVRGRRQKKQRTKKWHFNGAIKRSRNCGDLTPACHTQAIARARALELMKRQKDLTSLTIGAYFIFDGLRVCKQFLFLLNCWHRPRFLAIAAAWHTPPPSPPSPPPLLEIKSSSTRVLARPRKDKCSRRRRRRRSP